MKLFTAWITKWMKFCFDSSSKYCNGLRQKEFLNLVFVQIFKSSLFLALSYELICWKMYIILCSWGTDHEVKFHEIEIVIFHEIKITIMRLKLCLFMRSNLSNNIDQEVDTLIMRSKPKKALFLILISWSFLWLTNRSWDRN